MKYSKILAKKSMDDLSDTGEDSGTVSQLTTFASSLSDTGDDSDTGLTDNQNRLTDTAKMSYVSSAYIPHFLRFGGRTISSMVHKANESRGTGTDNIRADQYQDEAITLKSVSLIIAEHIPFSANDILQLNNVGSIKHKQGGFISPATDDESGGTSIEISPELISVKILDYTRANHVNFEAEIRHAEDAKGVQEATLGISLNAEGTCFYGMQIEAVKERRIKGNIPLDNIARILLDIQQHSSAIVDSIVSQHQQDLVKLVFAGDASNSNKVNLVIADEITPHLAAQEYMNKGQYRSELQQVLGDIKVAYDISENDTLVIGVNGFLVVGPNARLHEPLLCVYLQFITLDIFLQNYFARICILNDDIEKTNTLFDSVDTDPTVLGRARERICKLSTEMIKLEEMLAYLREALQVMKVPPEPPQQTGRSLYSRLEIRGMRKQLTRRTNEMKKNVVSTQHHLEVLRERANVASDWKRVELIENLEQNTKKMCALQTSNSDSIHNLQILQVIFSGIFAFDLLDRITGDWTVVDTTWMTRFVNVVLKKNILLWFAISILAWLLTAVLAQTCFTALSWRSGGMTTVKIKMNKRIHVNKIRTLLRSKLKAHEERHDNGEKDIVKVTYEEIDPKEWGGTKPTVTLEYDERNGFLFEATLTYNRRQAKKHLVFDSSDLKAKLLQDLDNIGLYDDRDEYGDDAF